MGSQMSGERMGSGGQTGRSSRKSFMRKLSVAVTGAVTLFALILSIGAPAAVLADSQPWVIVNDVTKARPTSGTTPFAFTISLTHPSAATVTVNYATVDSSARSTFDYQPLAGTATFTPGHTTVTVTVTVNGSTLHTGDRAFGLNLSNPIHATVQHNGIGTIVDSTLLPYLSVGDATVTQGSGTPGSAVFTVSLNAPSANKVRVHYYTSNGSATAGVDYTSQTGILTFPPSATTELVTVPITGIAIFQTVKYFSLNLQSPQNAAINDGSGLGTIVNSNHTAYVTADDVTVAEPSSGTVSASVPVRITPLSNFPVTISYGTSNGTAVSGTDYTTAAGTLTIPANTAQVNVPVTVNASGLTAPKYFIFNLSAASNGAQFIRSQSYVNITAGAFNQLTIGDVGVTAPASGTTTATFTVTLSPASGSTVSVNFATSDNTALAGTNYNATSGTLTFAPSVTTKTVSVTVKADTVQFADTFYFLSLSAQSAGITIQRPSAYGVIQANGPAPVISIAGATVTKPASGTATMQFAVALSAISPNTVTVNYASSNNSAVAGADFAATNGTVTFTPGTTTQTINVTVNGNTLAGPDLTLYMSLSSPINAQFGSSLAAGYIQNPNHNPTLSIASVSVYKAVSGTATAKLNVTLSSPSANTVTVNYTTANYVATAGVDYTATSGVLTFAPSVTLQSISVQTLGNTLPTGDRPFLVNLGASTNAAVISSQGWIDILDSSIVPYLSVGATSVQKPSTGSANAVFTVNLSPASPNTVSVNYTTGNYTAIAGQDYSAAVGTVTFPPGTSTRTVSVPVTASTLHTGDRAFTLSLNTPLNAVVGQPTAFATIIDPTFNPVLVVDDSAVLKPSSGTATLTSTVHLYPASPNTVTVNYTTADYTAVAGTDYVATSGILTFAPGDTSKTIPVTVNGSASSVTDRQFQVNLNTPVNAQLPGRSGAWGLIVDTVAPTSGLSYLMVQDAAVVKPSSGTATETFNVKLFPAATSTILVNYATSDYTAVAGAGDYVAARGTLTFSPSTTSQSVNVTVNGNTMPGSDKLLLLGLASNTGPSSVLRPSSYGSILNQQVDSRLWVGPDITINRGTSDSQNVSFSVSLNAPQQFPVQVDYTTNDGNTYAPEGYTPEAGTLTFAPGQTTQSVAVNVPGNAVFTGVQYFYFDLSNPINSSIGIGWAGRETVYIYNLDTFAIAGKVIDTTGAGLAGVTVTRAGNFAPTVAVTTAVDGSFTILNTIDGVYTVTPTLGGNAFLPANMSVTVRGSAMTAGPFLAYAGTGITGLADSAGKAKAGVTLTRTGGGAATVITTSDSLGYYAFGNVAAGTGYVVTPSLTNWSFNPASYTFNVASTTVKTQDFVALQGVIISGRVTIGGVGVSGVTITRTGGGAPTVAVKTNSQGYYGISNNPATVGGVTYTITPSKTGKPFTPTSASATVTTTSNSTGVDFTQN